MAKRSVVVVGGGVIGLSVAHYALRQGLRVTVLERGGPERDCCSLGNAGMVAVSHLAPLAAPGMVSLGLRMLLNPEGPFALRPRPDPALLAWCWRFARSCTPAHVKRAAPLLRDLLLASRERFLELAAETGNEFGLEQRGLLMLCRTEPAFQAEARHAQLARELGVTAEVLAPEETQQLEPGLRMTVAGSVYFPQDCHLVPERFVGALLRLVQDAGGELAWETEVTGWRREGERLAAARTNRGEIGADEFVLAGGAWTPQLTRELGLRLPLQAGKGYSVTLPEPRQLPALCAILTEARVAVTPMAGRLRFAGTMELGGLDLKANPRRVAGIFNAVPRYFPEFAPDDFRGLPVWAGLRPCTPDGLPYLGRTSRFPNLTVAAGHAMMGLSLAPATGHLVAQLLTGEEPAADLQLLRPERFG